MDQRLARHRTTEDREQFKRSVVDPFYREEEDYDWTAVTDRFHGLETVMHRLREQEFRRMLVRYGRPGHVLDVGCGSGLMLRHLPQGSAGIDLNPRNVARARRYVPTADIREGDAEHLPFADHAFTMVTATEVLEHLVFPERAVAEILRVLRPGGVFLGSVPRHTVLWQLRRFSTTCPAEEPFHNEMTRKELAHLLAPFSRFRIHLGFWLLQYSLVAWKANG